MGIGPKPSPIPKECSALELRQRIRTVIECTVLECVMSYKDIALPLGYFPNFGGRDWIRTSNLVRVGVVRVTIVRWSLPESNRHLLLAEQSLSLRAKAPHSMRWSRGGSNPYLSAASTASSRWTTTP